MSAAIHPARLALLGLPTLAYGLAIRLRNRLYERPGAVARAELPVISVGNLTVGGTGKTPFVAWLVAHLRTRGVRPAVVSRGYSGNAGKGPLLVSAGDGPLCEPVECGDEPYLLALTLPGSIVVVGADRVGAASRAARAGAAVVVLDDGFQHRRLGRDLDIVLLDSTGPFGNRRLLPAGRLREPVSGLSRAGLVVITRATQGERFPEIERVVRRYNRSAALITAGHELTGFVDLRGRDEPAPERAVAFCGVGNPERFRADLASRTEVADFRAYRDHHRFSRGELARLARLAAAHRAALVTTEKDLVRVRPQLPTEWTTPLLALRIRTVIHQPQPVIDAVERALRRAGA